MFFLAVLTIIYSYILFFLGIGSLLYPVPLLITTTCYIGSLTFYALERGNKTGIFRNNSFADWGILSLLFALAVVNSIGVLSPEIAFDATWYHLTFPKLYLQEHAIRFIPGGLFYYSVMPKLGELLFLPFVAVGLEQGAKFVQFFFGIATCFVVYTVSRRFVSKTLSLMAVLLFYSNIVVSWESTTAYIDLIRAFFEIMALWSFFLWHERKQVRWFILTAIMVGGAISVKLLALGSLVLFLMLIAIVLWKKNILKIGMYEISFALVSLAVVSPWLLFAFFTTGNPVYPFFTPIYQSTPDVSIFSLTRFFTDIVNLLLFSDDPISPIYVIILPLLLLSLKSLWKDHKVVLLYIIGSFILWYVTPRTGGGRFILPYLPAWSVLAVIVCTQWKSQKLVYTVLCVCAIVVAILTIGYRGIASARHIPVIIGTESKEEFLSKNLTFSFGDFYDTDGYFSTHIQPTDTVLLFGFHNLYYMDFPFIHSSYVKKGDTFTHVATQHSVLPDRFSDWKLIYENKQTQVKLYNKNNKIWEY